MRGLLEVGSQVRRLFVSTSKLQRYTSNLLSVHLGKYTIRENARPDWLIMPDGARLELDFYIEELRAAIEVQGNQHYIYIPHFHKTHAGFKQQLKRDRFKSKQCASIGITLFEVDNENDASDVVLDLAGKRHRYKTHLNAIEQGKKIYTIGSHRRNTGIFGEYPRTICKH